MAKHKKQKGAVIIICMIFLSIFAALAISMIEMSDINVQVANDYRHANQALTNAHSGLQVMRYYLADMSLSGNVAPENRLTAIQTTLQDKFTDESITNINFISGDPNTVNLNIAEIQSTGTVTTVISQVDDDTLRADITGTSGQFSRTLTVEFDFTTTGNSIFDFGVATKGPLNMSGQAGIDDVNLAIEAGVYIEGDIASGDAFSMTNQTSISDDVTIANPYASYSIGDHSSVAGATGEDADDHITVGSDYVDFPEPDTEYFRTFATGDVIDSNTNLNDYTALNNVTIAANTNPTFASHLVINGILFIEMPNTVTFAGQSIVNGIIIGDGDIENESLANDITFAGQVICNDMSGLTDPMFDDIKQETGTFILAPGVSLDFSGQALNMSGAIAASGISFTGQAGGSIDGSLINYSQIPVTMSGQSALTFNPSDSDSNPSGFVPVQILQFQPASYAEVAMY